MPKRPMEGVKILDFSWSVVGPMTAKILCDYGAEVIKLEGRNKADMAREIAGTFKDGIPGLDRAGRFLPYNTGKLSVGVNLAHPKGVELAKRFIPWADVVLETFSGGAMERMGLGYEVLKKIKPDIIMISSSMLGQTGPLAALPGLGVNLVAMAGIRNLAGWPDREEPADLEVFTDFLSPRFNILAIMAALDYRRRTGKGQYFDISQYECAIQFMSPLILDNAVNHRVAGRMGNRCSHAAPHGAYKCQGDDRWCSIAVFTDKDWENFCWVIGNPAWTKDPKFATLTSRKWNEDELDTLVEEWTINHSAEEVTARMQAAGVAAGTVQTTEDAMDHDPQLRQRSFFCELDHPEIGKYRAPRSSFVLSKSPCELKRAPLLGEHNEYALKKILGMSDEEIADLVIEEVLE